MEYFINLLQNRNLLRHNGKKLWEYALTDKEYEELISVLQNTREWNLAPRDATLYYAEWWRRNYNGGKPSKESVFESIGGNIQYNLDANKFYKKARKGAEILGIKWVSKQNTLYFRTLLLQGGLPLHHISENKSNYKSFLLAVLEEQPEKIEDFIFQSQIINLLPPSSRNDVIYENCFEIVQSILNNENYYEKLFSSNETIREISNALIVRKRTLPPKKRFIKPQNYWLFNTNKNNISLRLGLADKYSSENLSQILGFVVEEKSYQFYLNDELICVFRKMLRGDYKTDWHNQFKQEWNNEIQIPISYVISNNEKYEVKDFIQITPNLDKPTLWAPFSDNEWRLVKGSGVSSDKALLMFPNNWNSYNIDSQINLYGRNLNSLEFKGEVQLKNKDNSEIRFYKTDVTSFDWTIVSQKPNWVLKSNMPIVTSKPNILVYDEKNELVNANNYEIFAKYHAPNEQWQLLSEINTLPIGCIDLKIKKEDVVAFDSCYNIGNLNVIYSNQSINLANISLNSNQFSFKLEETPLLNIENKNNSFILKVNQEFLNIPTSIKASLKLGTSKSLFFELGSPFKGIALLNKDGQIIDENEKLTFKHLHGLRILTPNNSIAIIKMQNELRNEVIILKELTINPQPLISFKDELLRLYYLADAMDYRNKVKIELSSGCQTKTYFISGFTHTLDVTEQLERKIKLYDSNDELELYAVPLNCKPQEINLIPIVFQDGKYEIPNCEFTNQFIIISSKDSETQLMPRFVNTNVTFNNTDKNERIEKYYKEFYESNFQSEIWSELLVYFKICVEQNLPFSTFDQIRSISRDSKVTSKAFFYFGIYQHDLDEYIQKIIPEMEKDLGICFHWIKKQDWENAINEIYEFIRLDNYQYNIPAILSYYFQNNDLEQLTQFLSNSNINILPVLNPEINVVRAKLGERVLNELPIMKPRVNFYYNIPKVPDNIILLLNSPIAVAESILDLQQEYPIWGGDNFREKIRRNIQYSQYLTPDFYNHVILHVLTKQN